MNTPVRANSRPSTFMIPVLKLPLLLYRSGFGWMLGHRFMLLTHRGRRSGKIRQTVLAILRFDPKTKEIMAVSAWSASEWYRNIQSTPALQVETGMTHYVPVHRSITSEEIAQLIEDYRVKYPIFSRIVCMIPGWKWYSSHAEFLELANTLHGVAFQPKQNEAG